jgi:ferritin-like metal-binding protein YciE
MEKMKDLRDLLKHEIKDLYSAEEQIIMAMPAMIEKVQSPQLKQSLQRHLQITQEQLDRLEKVQQLMKQGDTDENEEDDEQEGSKEGLFTRLLRRRTQSSEETGSDGEKCRGMQGLIEEGEKVMAEEMEPSVMDAAIIACAQKIEHYEICGYGTARAFARELNLNQVAELLEETLDEEYEADDRLTDLAVGQVNEEAEKGGARRSRTRVTGNGNLSRRSGSSSEGRSNGRSASGSSTSRSKSGATAAASNGRSKSASKGSGDSSSARSNSGASGRSTGRSKSATKSSGGRSSSPAPASKASNTRSTAKSGGRGASTSKSRSAGNVPSKAAAAKGGRNSHGGGKTGASKGAASRGRGGSNGRSSGR